MATENLQIPDIQANQKQKEVTANAAQNLLDRAVDNNDTVTVAAGTNNLTTTQARENFVLELLGTPGAPFVVEMPDTNKRTMAIVNNSDDVATVKNPSAGGTGQPVIAVGEASIFHFDGTNFIDLSDLALAAVNLLALTDTPANYTDASGMDTRVNAAANGVEFVPQSWKAPVRLATVVDGTFASAFEDGDSIDGVALVTGDRILLKNQTAGEENGIYVVEATGAPTRAIDFDADADAVLGAVIPIIEGDTQGKTSWMHTTTGAITLDTTSLTFIKMEPVIGMMPLVLGTLRLLATDEIAGLLDNTTTPSFERIDGATDKGLRVLWGLSNNDEIAFPEVYMPPDFDSDKDITIHIVGEMSGATDTPTIDVLVFDSSGDTEMGGVTATFTDTRAEKTVTISAADITGHPLGWLSVSLIPVGAHATDTLAVFSVWIEYTRKTA